MTFGRNLLTIIFEPRFKFHFRWVSPSRTAWYVRNGLRVFGCRVMEEVGEVAEEVMGAAAVIQLIPENA